MNDNLCPFLSITLINLCKRLYHGYDTHASGRGCSKHHLRTLNLWYNSNLIPIKNTVIPFSSILICDHQNSPVELPQNQKDNKILVVFFFRHNKKYRCLLLTKHFSIKRDINEQYLFQFRNQIKFNLDNTVEKQTAWTALRYLKLPQQTILPYGHPKAQS